MNRIHKFAGSLFLLVLVTALPAAAQMVRHSGGANANLVILNEIGAVVGPRQDGDGLEVVTLLPNATSKSDVAVERGDLLLMVAGKRVSDIAVLREAYEGAEVGEPLKFGFRRGDERFLVSFEKQAQQQGTRMVMIGGPGQGGGDMQPVMEFGVVLREADGQVVVGMELPTQTKGLVENDVVETVNGKSVDSLAAFREFYEATKVGDDIEVVFVRGGDRQSMTRARMDTSGKIRTQAGR